MAKTKSFEFEVAVDGEAYVWRLQRPPAWSSDTGSFRGMAISARHQEGQREVVMEFPAPPQPKYGAPTLKASQIAPELVAKAIASAIEAGWEPMSRGKTITIVVDETGA